MKFLIMNLLLFAAVSQLNAQQKYEVLTDDLANGGKMLKGLITKNELISDPAFKSWYDESQRIYPTPDTAAVNALRNNADSIYFIVFGGTWCEDTHYVLPKFYKLVEASGFPEERITLYASDRNKHTTGTIAEALGAVNVPSIIVMKNGKEMGRVVEYGKTGRWDRELADIINQ